MTDDCYEQLAVWDTELSADAVEWCSASGLESILAVGTYQVDKSENDEFSSDQRRGKLFLLKFDEEKKALHLAHQKEFSPILDIEWMPQGAGTKRPFLATADACGNISLLELNPESLQAREVSNFKASEGLCLSLDWNKSATEHQRLITTDSKGFVHLLDWDSQKWTSVTSAKKHDYESWIGAFDTKDPNIYYSGGDDSLLKATDIRDVKKSAFTCKEHDAGVTSILSCSQSEKLLSGSYDEYLCLWDKRNMKTPVNKTNLGGGVWKIKQNPANPELLGVACMHNGFKVLHRDTHDLLGHYNEHQSLAYGLDWKRNTSTMVLASCSFYDHMLSIWRMNCK